MKTLSEICQLVKNEYIEGLTCDFEGEDLAPHLGLCSALDDLFMKNKVGPTEYELFEKEYKQSIENKKVFYNCDGIKVKDKSQFAWKVANRAARIKWLDQRI